MINSQCKKSDFSVFKVINADKGVYEIRWGYEPVIERITKFNEKTNQYEFTGETKETDYCSYAVERFYTKPNTYAMDKLFDNSTKYPAMSEMKEIAEGLEIEEHQAIVWMRDRLKKNVAKYDKSEAVEDFTINGVHMWLDSEMRAKVRENLETAQQKGEENVTLRYNEMAFPMSVTMGWQLYYAVLDYARATWDATQIHLATIDKFKTLDELLGYDYKQGYPDKLSF